MNLDNLSLAVIEPVPIPLDFIFTKNHHHYAYSIYPSMSKSTKQMPIFKMNIIFSSKAIRAVTNTFHLSSVRKMHFILLQV